MSKWSSPSEDLKYGGTCLVFDLLDVLGKNVCKDHIYSLMTKIKPSDRGGNKYQRYEMSVGFTFYKILHRISKVGEDIDHFLFKIPHDKAITNHP